MPRRWRERLGPAGPVSRGRASRRELGTQVDLSRAETRALRAGVLLSVTNPQNVAYWAALGSAMGALGVESPEAADYAAFFAGFMASSVVWAFACAALVARVFRLAGAGWARLTYRACAIAFLVLAVSTLRDVLTAPPGREAPPTFVPAPATAVQPGRPTP